MGFELVQQFLAKGHTVVGVSRNATPSANLRTLADEAGGHLMLFDCDIGDSKSVETFGKAIKGKVDSVDLLINNAGLHLPHS